ncbi:response regulator transcription factor [Naumannella sp. ID2617S]|nr:response regulator transcription factor [Naumannella sp. ID2617S]
MLTTFNVDELVTGALGAGARGFLLKDADPAMVLDGIGAVHRGEGVLDPAVATHVVAALRHTAKRSWRSS